MSLSANNGSPLRTGSPSPGHALALCRQQLMRHAMNRLRPLIAGNWKMNGLQAAVAEFEGMVAGAGSLAAKADLLVCPPATLLAAFADKARGSQTLTVGA